MEDLQEALDALIMDQFIYDQKMRLIQEHEDFILSCDGEKLDFDTQYYLATVAEKLVWEKD